LRPCGREQKNKKGTKGRGVGPRGLKKKNLVKGGKEHQTKTLGNKGVRRGEETMAKHTGNAVCVWRKKAKTIIPRGGGVEG